MTARLTADEVQELPCYNRPHLFIDDESKRTRQKAAAECLAHCPQMEWCERQRLETVRDHGSAVGVWAGKVWTHMDYARKGEAA